MEQEKMNGNSLCYVASGLSIGKFLYKDVLQDEKLVEQTGKFIERINGINSHKFSVLFNAFENPMDGIRINETMKKYVYDIYADSGGLQVISRGNKVTPELKRKVYSVQSKYSDIAMSFDEIPVQTLFEKNALKDTKLKVFDRSILVDKAKESAHNVTEQINFFIEEKTTTKPIVIIHGNCFETAKIWMETLYNEIPQHLHQYIGGFAIGSPAIGTGELEEIKKSFWLTQIPFEIKRKHFHLLGVGTIKRLFPIIFFIRNGLIKDTLISYDSTTHTRFVMYGVYYFDESSEKNSYKTVFNKNYTRVYDDIFEDIVKKYPEFLNWIDDPKLYHEAITINTTEYKKKYGSAIPNIFANNLHVLSSIWNFMKHVENVIKDEKKIFEILDGRNKNIKINAYEQLKTVKTPEDFKNWEKEFGRYFDSNPIHSNLNTLESFFYE